MDANSVLLKQLPVSIEAEQAVLGAIIIKPEVYDTIGGMLEAEDFYLDDHKNIFSAITRMYMSSKVIDVVTLVNELIELTGKTKENTIEYISLIADSVPSVSNVKEYVKIVKEKSILRRLISACDDINKEAYDEASPVREIVDNAQQRIFDIANGNDSKEFRHISDILQNVYTDLQTLADNKGAITGVKTGFSSLDNVLIQLGKGDFVIVGARPGMGKTSFAMNIATNVAKSSGKSVAIFSLEMTCEQLVTRILSSEALIDSYNIRTGQFTPEDWSNIADITQSLSRCNIYVDDTSQIKVSEMKAKLRRIPNLGLVVIDYLGLMETNSRIDNRAQAVGEVSRALKIMAKDFGVPILCCAQLNRGTESRNGSQSKRPTLSDLRDSGSIEQDADIVLFLYRDEYYKETGAQNPDNSIDASISEKSANTAEVIVAKNRHGAVGNITMGWIGKFTKFRSIEEDYSANG